MRLCEIRPRKDKRGVDLISDALPFEAADQGFSALLPRGLSRGSMQFKTGRRKADAFEHARVRVLRLHARAATISDRVAWR
jgi:hypothetical protein